jgi:hypothetical protein
VTSDCKVICVTTVPVSPYFEVVKSIMVLVEGIESLHQADFNMFVPAW